MSNKKTLRKHYSAKRKALSTTALEQKSDAVLNQVLTNNLISEGLLMLFFDSVLHREMPMQKWFERFENHRICVPKVIDRNGEMEAVLLEKEMPLAPNLWGILEPKSTLFVDPKEISTVVVPLLCFDQNGHRVGYGKGYYDRFLSRCNTTVKTIGISAFDAIQKIADSTSDDHTLNVAVTPKKVYVF